MTSIGGFSGGTTSRLVVAGPPFRMPLAARIMPPVQTEAMRRDACTRLRRRHRPAMVPQIALQSLEIGKRALRWHKAKLHQSAGGVIDEHQKRAGRRPIFEPAMVRTVDLDQLADMLTTMARLLDPLALGPR